jgi:hypothetical protein
MWTYENMNVNLICFRAVYKPEMNENETIRQFYRRMIRTWHPDKHLGNEKEMTREFQYRYQQLEDYYQKLAVSDRDHVVKPSASSPREAKSSSSPSPDHVPPCDDNAPKELLQVEKRIRESLQWKSADDLLSPCPQVGDNVRMKPHRFLVTVVEKGEKGEFRVLVLHTALGMTHDARKHKNKLVNNQAKTVCSRVSSSFSLQNDTGFTDLSSLSGFRTARETQTSGLGGHS